MEIDTYFKFELPFGDAWELHNYLVKVGKITSYAFLIQDEFSQTFKDTDKLKEYHDKLMENISLRQVNENLAILQNIKPRTYNRRRHRNAN